MTRILLCEDHALVREGLRQLLEANPEFTVLADVSSAEQLLKTLRKMKPDVLVLDIALPGRSGLEVLKQTKLLYPGLKVLVLSMYPEDQFAVRMIKAGASGYLHKDSPPSELYEALRTIARGGKYVSPAIMSLLFNEIAGQMDSPSYKSLSDREFEVLLLIGKGRKMSEIAASMSLSVKTVSTYKTRLLEKLHIKNYADITRYVLENNLT